MKESPIEDLKPYSPGKEINMISSCSESIPTATVNNNLIVLGSMPPLYSYGIPYVDHLCSNPFVPYCYSIHHCRPPTCSESFATLSLKAGSDLVPSCRQFTSGAVLPVDNGMSGVPLSELKRFTIFEGDVGQEKNRTAEKNYLKSYKDPIS